MVELRVTADLSAAGVAEPKYDESVSEILDMMTRTMRSRRIADVSDTAIVMILSADFFTATLDTIVDTEKIFRTDLITVTFLATDIEIILPGLFMSTLVELTEAVTILPTAFIANTTVAEPITTVLVTTLRNVTAEFPATGTSFPMARCRLAVLEIA
jgi:hypothetical protein